MQTGCAQSLGVQGESCDTDYDVYCGVSLLSWGQHGDVPFRAHLLLEGEKQSVIADKLEFGVHTDEYSYLWV